MRKTFVPLLAALALVGGCSSPDAMSVVTSEKGLTRIATLDATTHALLFAATDPFVPITNGVVITPANAENAVVVATSNAFTPTGCAVAVANGDSISYKLTGCDSPLGLMGITGVYTVNYSQVQNGIMVTIPRALVNVAGIPVFIQTSATYTQNGDQRTLQVNSAGAAPGDDYQIVQTTSSTLVWTAGSTCASEDASGTLTINGTALTQSVTGLTRCLDQCPQPSTFTLANGTETVITITFDGTADPNFSGSGANGRLTLACTAGATTVQRQATAAATSSLVRDPLTPGK